MIYRSYFIWNSFFFRLLDKLPPELAQTFQFFAAQAKAATAQCAAQTAQFAAETARYGALSRRDARFLALSSFKSLFVKSLQWNLGFKIKTTNREKNHFLDSLNGVCSWDGVDKIAVKRKIELIVQCQQDLLASEKVAFGVQDQSQICQRWDKLKKDRNMDQHELDQHEFSEEELSRIIAFYSDHIALGDKLEEEHEEIYRYFRSIKKYMENGAGFEPTAKVPTSTPAAARSGRAPRHLAAADSGGGRGRMHAAGPSSTGGSERAQLSARRGGEVAAAGCGSSPAAGGGGDVAARATGPQHSAHGGRGRLARGSDLEGLSLGGSGGGGGGESRFGGSGGGGSSGGGRGTAARGAVAAVAGKRDGVDGASIAAALAAAQVPPRPIPTPLLLLSASLLSSPFLITTLLSIVFTYPD